MEDQNICRICSNKSKEVTLLCDAENLQSVTSIGQKFIDCFHLEILAEKCFPYTICNYCELQLNVFDLFRKKAIESHAKFETLLKEIPEWKLSAKCMDSMSNTNTNDIPSETENEIVLETLSIPKVKDIDAVTNVKLEFDDSSCYTEIEYLDSEQESIENLDQLIIGNDAGNRGFYKCNMCSKSFRLLDTFEAHQNTHKGLMPYACQTCNKTFRRKANYLYHMQDHINYRPNKCHLCEKQFKNKADLATHIAVHMDIRKYTCDICGQKFRAAGHLSTHLYSHDTEKRFRCDPCARNFQSPKNLRAHIKIVHSTELNFVCDICSKAFKRKHHLETHFKVHRKNKVKR